MKDAIQSIPQEMCEGPTDTDKIRESAVSICSIAIRNYTDDLLDSALAIAAAAANFANLHDGKVKGE